MNEHKMILTLEEKSTRY